LNLAFQVQIFRRSEIFTTVVVAIVIDIVVIIIVGGGGYLRQVRI